MNKLTNYLDQHKTNPIFQSVIIGVVAFIAMALTKMSQGTNTESNFENIWLVVIMFLLFFALFNTVICLSIEKQVAYFWKSITCFFILLAFLIFSAYLFSGVSYNDAGFFRWIIMVVGFGYLVFFSIVMAMHRIVKFAQKQDKKLRNEE